MQTIDIQEALNKGGYALQQDNRLGPKTLSATKDFLKKQGFNLSDDSVEKLIRYFLLLPEENGFVSGGSLPSKKILPEYKIIEKYGQPGPSNLVVMDLPYKMVIAWDKTKFATKIQVHKLIEPKLKAALQEALDYYGIDKIKELGLDQYGGCYNLRKMTGGSSWSMHSWGVAIDIDPERNQYSWGHDQAQMAKPEYKKFIEIFYKHGFLNLGVERNKDFMHFQIAE